MKKSTGCGTFPGTLATVGATPRRVRVVVAAVAAAIAAVALAQGFQAPDIDVREGSKAEFKVTLPHGMAMALRWKYETEDGTATSGSDYESTTGYLVVAAGDTTEAVEVKTLADLALDDGETFKLKLHSFQLQRSNGSWASDAVYGIPDEKTITATIKEGTLSLP